MANTLMRQSDTRERIIVECIRQFNEQGAGFTMDSIARSLKISKKTIYKYFLSKDAIFCSLVDEIQEGIYEEQKKIAADESLAPVNKLYRLLTVKAKYEDIARLDRITELETTAPALYRYFMAAYETQWSLVEAALAEGMEAGIYKKVDVRLARMLLQNGMQMLYRGNLLTEGGKSYQELLHQVVTLVLDGICERKTERKETAEV